jgi:hypothetical protein
MWKKKLFTPLSLLFIWSPWEQPFWCEMLKIWSVIMGFLREAHENCALLCYYAASRGNSFPTFPENLLVQSARVKNTQKGCPETSIRNYHYLLRNNPQERQFPESINFAAIQIRPSSLYFLCIKPVYLLPFSRPDIY